VSLFQYFCIYWNIRQSSIPVIYLSVYSVLLIKANEKSTWNIWWKNLNIIFCILFIFPATEEDGWQDKKVSDFEQPGICCTEQVLEVRGPRWSTCRTCTLFPATHTSFTCHNHIDCISTLYTIQVTLHWLY
jgi:hypothetical protein